MQRLLQPGSFIQNVKVTAVFIAAFEFVNERMKKKILTVKKSNLSRNRAWSGPERRPTAKEKDV